MFMLTSQILNLSRVVFFTVNYLGSVGENNNIIYFILSSEINVYQKWIKVLFSLQN